MHLKKAMQAIAGLTKVSISTYHPNEPKGDMLKYQSSLSKLPVPPLQQSLQKYLKAVRPLVSDAEFKRTHQVVEEFGMKNGIGERLQKALEDRAKTHDNWVSNYYHDLVLWRQVSSKEIQPIYFVVLFSIFKKW